MLKLYFFFHDIYFLFLYYSEIIVEIIVEIINVTIDLINDIKNIWIIIIILQ